MGKDVGKMFQIVGLSLLFEKNKMMNLAKLLLWIFFSVNSDHLWSEQFYFVWCVFWNLKYNNITFIWVTYIGFDYWTMCNNRQEIYKSSSHCLKKNWFAATLHISSLYLYCCIFSLILDNCEGRHGRRTVSIKVNRTKNHPTSMV